MEEGGRGVGAGVSRGLTEVGGIEEGDKTCKKNLPSHHKIVSSKVSVNRVVGN